MIQTAIPVKNFLYDLVVLEPICCRTRANQLINVSNTTGWLEKFWTGIATGSLHCTYKINIYMDV